MIEAIDNIGIEWLLGSDSSILDHIALTMTNAWTWVPLYVALLILIIKNNDNMQQIMVCFGFAILCVALASLMANVPVK